MAVLLGRATVGRSVPVAHDHKEYLRKYRKGIKSLGMTPKEFGEGYSVPILIVPARLRGF